MYSPDFLNGLTNELECLKETAKYKYEKEIEGRQGSEVIIAGKKVLMFASNNYLGLANHPKIVAAAKQALDTFGYGLSSVRFLSGTQTLHKELEKKIAGLLGTEDAILYSTNFMANLGFFASVVNEGLGQAQWKDVIYSDALNHASIIDAFKLCAKEHLDKRIYPHADIDALRTMLEEDKNAGYRNKIIVTDGVFSMEGDTADLAALKSLADEFGTLLFVDDAHGVGVLGTHGAGTPEAQGLHGKIDVLSGTLGKALGGAVGGYTAGKKELIDFLRQKSRTYIFSNSLPPSVAAASIQAIDLLSEESELLALSKENAVFFREALIQLGFTVLPGSHPIVPVMLGDAQRTQEMSKRLLEEGVYVVGLWFPVVPEGEARLRFQVSAAHTKDQLQKALSVIEKVGKELGVI